MLNIIWTNSTASSMHYKKKMTVHTICMHNKTISNLTFKNNCTSSNSTCIKQEFSITKENSVKHACITILSPIWFLRKKHKLKIPPASSNNFQHARKTNSAHHRCWTNKLQYDFPETLNKIKILPVKQNYERKQTVQTMHV